MIRKLYFLHCVDDFVSCIVEDSSSRKGKAQPCQNIGEYFFITWLCFMNWLNLTSKAWNYDQTWAISDYRTKMYTVHLWLYIKNFFSSECSFCLHSLLTYNGQLLFWNHLQFRLIEISFELRFLLPELLHQLSSFLNLSHYQNPIYLDFNLGYIFSWT